MVATTPRIVLAGARNIGKSSLIERLCGINVGVPSYGVTEWHISPGPISAQVYISWFSPLGHTTPRVPFGQPLHDLHSIESTVRRAQLVVFLPENEASQIFDYVDALIFELHASLAEFRTCSPHVVHVVYQHPDAPLSATIVDLPGLLNSGTQQAIESSKETTLANIKDSKAIIVAVLPLSSSSNWRTTWDLVEQEDPYGHRTIGLFTKLCIPSDFSDVLEGLLSCKTTAFACLYYPEGPRARQRTSQRNSRFQEARFFSETLPWAEIMNRRSLGIDAFLAAVKRLSDEPHPRPLDSQRPMAPLLIERRGRREGEPFTLHDILVAAVALLIMVHVVFFMRFATSVVEGYIGQL